MKNLIFIILLIGIIYLLDFVNENESFAHHNITTLTGFILLSGFIFANLIKKAKLPRLTGYMLIGIITGPFILNIISHESIEQLAFMESLALSFIALNAGGELRLDHYKKYKKSVILILIFQIIVVFIGAGITFAIVGQYISFLRNVEFQVIIGFSILFAAISISKSPSTTIGIITEVNAKGKTTDIILAVTIFKSMIIVLLFPIFIGWAKIYFHQGGTEGIEMILPAFVQLLSSIFSGIVIGFLTVLYLAKIKEGIGLFLLGIALVITELSSLIGLEILLSSMIVGIVVQNFSKHGDSLIKGLEMFSLPIYVSFFFLTGASLHIDVITKALFYTFILVVIRTMFIYSGTFIGAKLANEDEIIKKHSWMGYIGQAGIALGLSVIVEQSFPGEIGKNFISIVIATVVINELLGPILFKYVLSKAKEINEEDNQRKRNYPGLRGKIS